MRRTACISCLPALLAACHSGGAPMSSFGTLPVTTDPAEQTTGTSSTGAESSTSYVPEDSTSAASTDTSAGGTTLVLDVGTADLGVPGPEGCQGKIDFLFVISRWGNPTIQDKMVAALPDYIATIQSRFADFDYHIMVVDSDHGWGNDFCNNFDCDHELCTDPNYPCDAIDSITSCDERLGAGTIFNAGRGTFDKPCGVAGGKRYLDRDQPDLPGTFECIARVGLDGGVVLVKALVHALTPGLTGDCNAGFLRDDALLFVSLISYITDEYSPGKPSEWAQTVIDAKHGDAGAVVMLNIGPMSDVGWSDLEACADAPQGRVCKLLEFFPYRLAADHAMPDYGPAFEQAADLVGEACSAFIPQ